MAGRDVPFDTIQVSHPIRESLNGIDRLKSSIHRLGLRTPLLVNPVDLELISGHRRYSALRELRKSTVRAVFPEDVKEACRELGEHVTEPASQDCSIPMTLRERVNLALRLQELPKPTDEPKRHFSYTRCTAPFIGIPPHVLRRLIQMIDDSEEGCITDDAQVLRNRRALHLMLAAFDSPPPGVSGERAVESLCRQRIWEGGTVSAPAPDPDAGQLKLESVTGRAVPVPRRRSWTFGDFRLGLDGISGGITGLLNYGIPEDMSDGARTYAIKEIKKSRHELTALLKHFQEM